MKAVCLAAVVVLFGCYSRAITLIQWNFNSPVADANPKTGTTIPSYGNGAAGTLGAVTSLFASGATGATGDTNSADNSGWQTAAYPSATTSNKTAGVRFDFSTAGFSALSVSWAQENSSTASRYTRFQYTLDGGNTYRDADLITIYVDGKFTNQTVNLAAIPGVANNPAFGFRLVTEWQSTATGSGSNAFVATAAGSSYSTQGTIRFDLVTVSGTLLPGGNTPPSITTLSNQTLRVNQTSAALGLTVADAEDLPDRLLLSKASSDPLVVPPANISFGGSANQRTVTVTAGARSGSAIVTLYVTDSGGKSNQTSFLVTVLSPNTPPVLSGLGLTNTLVNTPTPPLSFVIGDLESPASTLQLSARSANPALVAPADIVFGGNASNRTVTLTPLPGQTGVAPITICVSDGVNTTQSVFPLLVSPSASVVLYEPFGYPDGSVVTNSAFLWEHRSGAYGGGAATNGQLLLSPDQTEDVAAALIGAPYAKSNGLVLYASFKVKCLSLPKSAPFYFAHFLAGTSHRARLFAGSTNAAPGHWRLFVSNGSETNAMLNTDLEPNLFYTVVTRYKIDSALATLWLNPKAESDPGLSGPDTQAAAAVSGFGFRQDAALGSPLLIDDLRVGLAFAAVLPGSSGGVTPVPLTIERNANTVTLRWTNGAAVLQAAPAVSTPFTNVPNAASPYAEPAAKSARFYRLKF